MKEQQKNSDGLINLNIPMELVDTVLPEPYRLNYYQNLEERILWIDKPIDEESLDVIKKIYQWNEEDSVISLLDALTVEDIQAIKRKPITIYFNSPGGFLDMSIAIAQCIKDSKTPIIGINTGECSSGAALIFSQCHVKVAVNTAFFLIHKGSGAVGGTHAQSKAHQKHWDHMVEQMDKMLLSIMKIDQEEYNNLAENEWFLYMDDQDPESTQNARRYNLITEEYNK